MPLNCSTGRMDKASSLYWRFDQSHVRLCGWISSYSWGRPERSPSSQSICVSSCLLPDFCIDVSYNQWQYPWEFHIVIKKLTLFWKYPHNIINFIKGRNSLWQGFWCSPLYLPTLRLLRSVEAFRRILMGAIDNCARSRAFGDRLEAGYNSAPKTNGGFRIRSADNPKRSHRFTSQQNH